MAKWETLPEWKPTEEKVLLEPLYFSLSFSPSAFCSSVSWTGFHMAWVPRIRHKTEVLGVLGSISQGKNVRTYIFYLYEFYLSLVLSIILSIINLYDVLPLPLLFCPSPLMHQKEHGHILVFHFHNGWWAILSWIGSQVSQHRYGDSDVILIIVQ